MKKLLFVLLLISTSAIADIDDSVIARTSNKAGGVIVFTTRQGNCEVGLRSVYATSTSNTIDWGCWFSADGFIFVQWQNGTQTSYDITTLHYSDWVLKKLNIPKISS